MKLIDISKRARKIQNLLIERLAMGILVILFVSNYSVWAQIQYNEQILTDALANGITLGIPGISVAIGKGDSIIWKGTDGYSDLINYLSS